MLNDPRAIEIISAAKQANVRDPHRKREPFHRILQDYLDAVDFEAAHFLDLGPGQYDFAELAKLRGATVTSIDKDPAVIALGEYLGFRCVQGDIREVGSFFDDQSFDGIFCKYSINAFWLRTPEDIILHVQSITRLLKPEGWGWIAPWNGIPKDLPADQVPELLAAQISAFQQCGFLLHELNEEQSRLYGVHGRTANKVVFTRGLVV